MHASLVELLENMRTGLLWVSKDGVVRYANGDAGTRTGLVPGRKLYDPDLARTVAQAVAAKGPQQVTALGAPRQPGGAIPELACRVIPGFTADDAFVLIGQEDDGDPHEALANLMMVIRSDLTEPLAQARDALALVRHGESDPHAADALAGELDDLLGTLGRLVDLASVWGSSSLLANDRIELWDLLKDVWREVEPLALDRHLKVRFRAHGTNDRSTAVYGSREWIRRVFLECMDAAVRAAPRGDVVEIEHRQIGPRAMVVFRDCGAFARSGGEDMPTAGAGTAHKVQRAREQISLKLCRHVVALHGGALREETEDGQRNFLIDLPTGAPHREDTTQLDIAQAQQYAKDLAALMARARHPRTPTAA